MSASKNCPETTRQRMIGMMYLVLTAMLALNVSSEVLNGFSMVDNSLHNTIQSSVVRNTGLYDDFQNQFRQNPTKVKEWLDKAILVKQESDSLFDYLQDFKYQIVKRADGKKADPTARNIINKENFDVPGEYALVEGNGKILKQKIDSYRDFIIQLSENNPAKQKMYATIFSTAPIGDKPWEVAMFEMMPVSAVVTLLTKYQSDVRMTEVEVVQYLKSQTDIADFRVNKIEALVVPNSRYVIRGGKYSAQIILSAVDSTKTPQYFVGNTPIPNGIYEITCTRPGTFTYSGYIQLTDNQGIIRKYPFQSDYIVGEPSATISNEDLNVVYRGVDNKFSISVPGIPAENIFVRTSGGTAQKISNGRFIIHPTQDKEMTIFVYAKVEGREMQMGSSTYRVKYLPDPKSYLQYVDAGGITRLIQEGTISKRLLKGDNVLLVASYGEDELVQAKFNIVSFTMVTIFGAISNTGPLLNSKQLESIDRLEGGDYITFKNIKAVGPDGKIRNLSPIQIQI
ncbi:MAG: gliding motility protein GldM [Paludibacteraceae bacterium]|nr:gliding motility protein GldM [Paludibacteraceae bacterium]